MITLNARNTRNVPWHEPIQSWTSAMSQFFQQPSLPRFHGLKLKRFLRFSLPGVAVLEEIMRRMTVRQLVHHLSRIKHATRCSALRAAATGGSESEEHLEKNERRRRFTLT
jgi:hypothetical protein